MPSVPGTKVWIRNGELARALSDMDETPYLLYRIAIAEKLATTTLERSRQSKSYFKNIKSFIIKTWIKNSNGTL